MSTTVNSQYLNLLKNRIDLHEIPFSDRGSRLLIFYSNGQFTVLLAERWFKREGQLSAYRKRTLDLICCRNDIYEYYHLLTGENPPNAASMFGWSSAVFIDLAIQAARENMQ